MSGASRTWLETWRWPMLIAVLTAAGLLSALLGERGAWLALSWALLTIPLAVIVSSLYRGRNSGN